MIDENLQYALSQYADGTLAQAERAAVEQLLAHNAEARQTLAEYRRLSMLLDASAAPLPSVDWSQLTQQISRAIDRSQSIPGSAAIAAEQAASETYLMGWGRRPWVWAIAASLLIASGVVWISHQGPGKLQTSVAVAPPAVAPPQIAKVAEIRVLQGEIANGPAVVEVSVGPSGRVEQASVWQLYPEVAQRPFGISIAGGPALTQRDEPYAAQ